MGVDSALAATSGGGAVSPGDGASLAKPADWPAALLAQVAARSDEEIAKDALLIGLYRAHGASVATIARKLGQTAHWVRTTLKVARARKLVDPATVQAREEIEGLLDLTVDNVRKLLKKGDRETTLAVARGTGVLRTEQDAAGAAMRLEVVMKTEGEAGSVAVGVRVAAGEALPASLAGVVGAPNSSRPAGAESVLTQAAAGDE